MELLNRMQEKNPFLTPHWVFLSYDYFGVKEFFDFYVLKHNGKVVGFLPLSVDSTENCVTTVNADLKRAITDIVAEPSVKESIFGFLLERFENVHVVEIDRDSVAYLKKHFPLPAENIREEDFLKMDLKAFADGGTIAVTGNFPYNISSQIVFKVLEKRELVPVFTGMFQKEVAERITARHGNKTYGILSVLAGIWYEREYLFDVPPQVFYPQPKVHSAVIRLTAKQDTPAGINWELLKKIVKTSFGMRRKVLRNSLKAFNIPGELKEDSIFARRPEQLSPDEFVELTGRIEKYL
jgi:16S rRNA (adenine1518-N6/adenine1519-N6)-dimethyltransferase